MPFTVRKFNAQVRDTNTGEMIPAGLLSSDALGAINEAKTDAVSAVQSQQTTSVNAVIAAGTAASANFPQTAVACDTLAGDFAATYVPNQAYSAGDYCTYQYQLYRCKADIPENTDTTFVTSHWQVVKLANTLNDEVGDLKTQLDEITEVTSKNLFNKNAPNELKAYINTSVLTGSSSTRTIYIKCKPSTTYTVSKQEATARFAVAYSKNLPSVGGSIYGTLAYNNNTAITITTGDDAEYLLAYVYSGSADTKSINQIYDILQIEEGSSATSYEPYAITAVDNAAREQSEANEEDISQIEDELTKLSDKLTDVTSAGKNIFNKNDVNYITAYVATGKFVSSNGARTVYVPCKANTTYTVSKSQASQRFTVVYATGKPVIGGDALGAITYNGNTSISITTGNDATYLAAYIYLSSADTLTFEEICNGLQIEEGESATRYEPYKLTAVDTVARGMAEANSEILDGLEEQISITSDRASAEFGDEMITDFSALTPIGGSTYDDGTWIVPFGGGLSTELNVTSGTRYYIQMTVSRASTEDGTGNEKVHPLEISLGNASISIYAVYDANWRVCLVANQTGATNLVFQASEQLSIDFTNISVKPVTALPVAPIIANGLPFFSAGQNNGYSVAFGGGQWKKVTKTANTAFGYHAQQNLDTANEDTAVGYQAQYAIRNGRANTAVGNCAQQHLTTGMYNNAIGTVAQGGLAGHEFIGCWNNALGNEAQRDITTGCNNVGVGRRAQSYIQTGNMNIAIGAFAGFATKGHQDGSWGTIKSSFQTLVGGESTQAVADTDVGNADYLTTLGYRAVGYQKAIAIGANAEAKGEESIAIGYGVKVNQDNTISVGSNDHSIILCGKRIIFNQDGTVSWENVT